MSAHITHRTTAWHRLAETIRLALCKLNEKQFEAPWNPRRPRC